MPSEAQVPIACQLPGNAPDTRGNDALGVPSCTAEGAAFSALRLDKLRAVAAQCGDDAFLVRDTSNVRWLTAFDDVFDDERAHALLVTPDRAVLHTDSRYSDACAHAAAGTGIVVDASRVSHAKFAAECLAAPSAAETATSASDVAAPAPVLGQDGCPTLAIEDTITLAEYRQLQAAFGVGTDTVADSTACACNSASANATPVASATARLRETTDVVVGLRAVKDAGEVARLRAAQAITDAAFAHIVAFMRPGMTERAVQRELEDFMLRHGAEGLAFSSIVATGANGASPHAIPGDTVLEAGQCVVLDFGARAQGYCSDMTRTVFLGQPSDRLRAAYQALRCANEEVERMLKPGVTGKEMHELAELKLAEGGFGGLMGHGLGHGVGIDIHELPVLSPRNENPLVAGNVVTVEPGIYVPGEFGMRLEDFGIVDVDGFCVFTQSSHDMVVL